VLSVFEPPGPVRGGVVGAHEAFGLDGWFTSTCESLAADGWMVVAPHLFHRTGDPVLGDLTEAGPHLDALTLEGVLADVDAAVARLDRPAASVGIVGFSMGANVALNVAAARSLGAAVGFYGGGIRTTRLALLCGLACLGALQTPWLGLYGARDPTTPASDLDALEGVAAASSVEARVVRYPTAGHGFLRREGWVAVDGRRRALAWLDGHLASDPA
jgi:carboxymethylenebutenolidase